MVKRFFYVAMGVLALSVAYHLGAAKTDAQGVAPFVSITQSTSANNAYALTSDGDLYIWQHPTMFRYIGNFRDDPVSVDPSSLGAVKGSYR